MKAVKTKTRFGGRRCCLCGAKAPVTLHSFPKQDDARSLWKRICNYESYDDVSRLWICTNHFTRFDYYFPDAKQYGVRKLNLKPNCFPSVNVPNKIEPNQELVSSTFQTCDIDVTANLECILEEGISNEEPTQLQSASMLDPLSSTTILENTGNLAGEVMETPKKRKFRKARYFGDITTADMNSPRKAERMLFLARKRIKQVELKNESFRKKNNRLLKKVKSLQDLVNHLKKNITLSEDAADTLIVNNFSTVSD